MACISDSASSLFHDMLKPLVVIMVVLILLMFASSPLLGLFSSLRLISEGRVKVLGVGVYLDVNCTSPVYSLEWGSVEPSSMKTFTVFIRNEGNEPSTLFLNTTNWNPTEASELMMLNWDYNGRAVLPRQVTEVTLTLSILVSAERINDFTFDIIIGANEYV